MLLNVFVVAALQNTNIMDLQNEYNNTVILQKSDQPQLQHVTTQPLTNHRTNHRKNRYTHYMRGALSFFFGARPYFFASIIIFLVAFVGQHQNHRTTNKTCCTSVDHPNCCWAYRPACKLSGAIRPRRWCWAMYGMKWMYVFSIIMRKSCPEQILLGRHSFKS